MARPCEVQELMGVGSQALVDRYTRSFRITSNAVVERGRRCRICPSAKLSPAVLSKGKLRKMHPAVGDHVGGG